MTTTIGSLFSGFGGLCEMTVAKLLDGDVIWHCEFEPPTRQNPRPTQAAARLLRYRYPDTPNLGDVTAVDWTLVSPVFAVTTGFPCTDVALPGKRAGLTDDTRSGLWRHSARAIGVLRPRLVFIENVRGLASAKADSPVEPCPMCVGDGPNEHVLRALGAVLGDLADLGYDAVWCGLPASAVGAPHERYRIFILACDTTSSGWKPRETSGWVQPEEPRSGRFATAHPDGIGSVRGGAARGWRNGSADHGDAPTDAEHGDLADRSRTSGREGWQRPSERGGTGPGREGAAAHTDGEGPQGPEPAGRRDVSARGATPNPDSGEVRPQPELVTWCGGPPIAGLGRLALADPNSSRESQPNRAEPDVQRRTGDSSRIHWGRYAPAIDRWAAILGRPAPVPTVLSDAYLARRRRRLAGKDRRPVGMRGSLAPVRVLNPELPEWMMGLPEGHLTQVPGVTRSEALKLAGNGVCPQQGYAAFTHLLSRLSTLEVAA